MGQSSKCVRTSKHLSLLKTRTVLRQDHKPSAKESIKFVFLFEEQDNLIKKKASMSKVFYIRL